MAHFAHVVNGIVQTVIVADQDFIDSGAVGDPGEWVKTSYNTRGGVHYGEDGEPSGRAPLRGNFAGTGYVYDAARDVFYPPQPHPYAVLDERTWSWGFIPAVIV